MNEGAGMSQNIPDINVLFVAGFGPVAQNSASSASFYVQALGLPLKPLEGNGDYLVSEEGLLKGVKHFAVRPHIPALALTSGQLNTRYHRDGLNMRYGISMLLPVSCAKKGIASWWLTAPNPGGRQSHAC